MRDYAFFAREELDGSLPLRDGEMVGVNVAHCTVGLYGPARERGGGFVEVGGEEDAEGSVSEHPGAFFEVTVDGDVICKNRGKRGPERKMSELSVLASV